MYKQDLFDAFAAIDRSINAHTELCKLLDKRVKMLEDRVKELETADVHREG
jgi:hypothetical protein